MDLHKCTSSSHILYILNSQVSTLIVHNHLRRSSSSRHILKIFTKGLNRTIANHKEVSFID